MSIEEIVERLIDMQFIDVFHSLFEKVNEVENVKMLFRGIGNNLIDLNDHS